jgi:hypothetical protein
MGVRACAVSGHVERVLLFTSNLTEKNWEQIDLLVEKKSENLPGRYTKRY